LTCFFCLHQLWYNPDSTDAQGGGSVQAGTFINGVLCVDGVTLDVEHNQVTGPMGAYHLTPLECRLLQIFMLHPDQVISRSWLMKEVWETDYLDDIRTLHVHICWLRRKIEEDPSRPRRIITHRGLGYELHVSGASPSK
jgi:DNA-binding response OmpR family regulator